MARVLGAVARHTEKTAHRRRDVREVEHVLGFDEPALAPQPLDIPFRLRLVKQAGGPCLKTSYFGTLATMT